MQLDIVFLSYSESNADENWQHLKARFPRAKRVHGVKGIANAHKAAADASDTEFFFVVDGDNKILPEFDFTTGDLNLQSDTIYVWRCRNPVNDLEYGYGAVKLYNKSLLKHRYENQFVDLASTVTEKYHIVHAVASETHFFSTPEEAWRGAFRECAKLASQSIERQKTEETQQRLNTWCEKAHFLSNSQWVLLGAKQGREFGRAVLEKHHDLKTINDFQALNQRFQQSFQESQCQISVVIPTHQRHKDVLKLLQSIQSQSLPTDCFEVIVVSNFADPELESLISNVSWGFRLQLLSVGELGVNRARNLGLKRAFGDVVFFLDDDCELIDKDHLKILRSQHLFYPHAVAIGGGYEIPSGTGYVSKVYHAIASSWFRAQSSKGTKAENLLGGNVSYKTKLLSDLGLQFDEEIIFGGAESEFHARLRARHLELRNSDLNVCHHLKMNLSDFYRKAFLQGMGLEKTQKHLVAPTQNSDSPSQYAFMRYQYERVFNKGRSFARKNSSSDFSSLPYQSESWGLFLLNAILFLPFGVMRPLFWAMYSLALQTVGFGRRVLVFFYWQSVKIKTLVGKVVRTIFWSIYHYAVAIKGLSKRIAIALYWKMYPLGSYAKGRWKKYSVRAYWFFYYLRKQFHKDLQKKMQLWHFGIDTNNLPRSLKLAEAPSLYLPVSGQCSSSCGYCPQLKAKWNYKQQAAKPKPEHLSAMGFSGVTFPCNFLSMELSEQTKWLDEYKGLGRELLINPDSDFFSDSKSAQQLLSRLRQLESPSLLLLFRQGRQFDHLLKGVKNLEMNYRILFIFEVSGDPKKLYQSLEASDWGKVQFLNSNTQSPEVTDDRNRKLAPRVGKAISHFHLKDLDFWPETSHVHFPFLVADDSKASIWADGRVDWTSPANDSMAVQPKYSLVVPVRHQIDHARKVLKNLSKQHYDSTQFEILFVDDGNDLPLGSSIEQAWVEASRPKINIRVIHYPRETLAGYDANYRAGQARNMGLRFAKGERLLFLDSDILIAPDLFEKLDQSLKDNMIIQFPRYMLTEEATKDFTDYESIQLKTDTYSQSSYWEEFKRAERWMDLKNYWKYTCTYGLCLTRKTLESIGPFRSDFIYYGFEDVDLGYRLFQRGGEFHLLKSPVYHLFPDKNHSFHFDAEKRYQALSRSASIFFHRNMDLNFYFDLKGFLNRPWHIRMRKPYYTVKYQAQKRLPILFGAERH